MEGCGRRERAEKDIGWRSRGEVEEASREHIEERRGGRVECVLESPMISVVLMLGSFKHEMERKEASGVEMVGGIELGGGSGCVW